MKLGTVALVISYPEGAAKPVLEDVISDDREIGVLESAIQAGEVDPLHLVYEYRNNQSKEDDEFGDYIESLLTQPFVRTEIQEHGLRWLKSKMRIEFFQKKETEAAQVIAQYAFKVYLESPEKMEFLLAGPNTAVKIRIFKTQHIKDHKDQAA